MKKIDRDQLANSELSGGCCKAKNKPAPCPTPVPDGGGSGGLNRTR